jgi:perosamine synthetase
MIPIFKPTLGDEELKEVKDTFDSHWIGLGPRTKKFEEDFKKYIGCKSAISLNSCTAALHLALLALDIKKGDEVLISSMTFASTGHAVLFCGAKPILVDVDKETLTMDIDDLKKKITDKTKIIIPVHYGGHICDMDEILKIAKENNLYVIEDAANCTGAEYKGKKIGNLDSDFTCFSFEAKKNMTTGDGGMLVTNKEGKIIDKLNCLKWVGMDKDTLKRFSGESKPWEYDITELGYKYNMNDITAAIGLIQLKKLDQMNDNRNNIIKKYNESFSELSWLKIPIDREPLKNAYWLYILRIEEGNRDDLMRHLFDNGVSASTNFKPLHLFTFYKNYYNNQSITVDCPIAEQEWEKIVILPLFPDMTNGEVDEVIKVVKSFKQ